MVFVLPSTPFYLLRHGESEANLAGKAAGGGVDSPLTSKGEDQARELAEVIHNLEIKPSLILASPMKRAYRTAEIINEVLNLPIQIVKNLEEHHVGTWEGQPWSEIGPRMKAGEIPPGGENYEQYAHRVKRVLSPLLDQVYETPPLIVAHGGTFRSIGYLYGYDMNGTRNCHLHRFVPLAKNNGFPWQIWEYNVRDFGLYERRSAYCPLSVQGETL